MFMRNKWALLSAGVLLGTMLTGCGMENQGDLGNKNLKTNQVRYDAFGNIARDKRFANDMMNERNRVSGNQAHNNNLVGSHKNYRLEMSSEAADRIKTIGQVRASYVMLADKNAYVAVSLHDTGNQGNAKMMSRTNMGFLGRDGAAAGKRMSSLSTGEEKLSEELKAQIAGVVKDMYPQIGHIYISANPEFVGRMNAYMNDAVLGYPVQNYVMEFNAMVERVFPAAKTNYAGDGIIQSTTTHRRHRLFE
ncbi:hypothetical protein D3P08_13350 [Paenibacillus nanensis]|uniref:YhcN/YlaJ family sporulation lipoprotein n=2 Tax=Paenibacillus nanensis TaxID=393251 RepID=A0A3A1UVZ7_9BACL|nr:hypothetical protein D3P08_13350 [Paenibacillus nanensis]